MLLSLFISSTVFAAEPYNIYGPQPNDKIYLYFGKDDEPKSVPNGINLDIDQTSVSYQSILATVTIPNDLIQDRRIDRFYIVRNGQRIVDWFDPSYDNWLDVDRVYYPLTIRVTDEYIGSIMEFQIVAVSRNNNGEYVVAWSNISPAVQFKPLPTIDHTAISVLENILARLEALQASLEQKLAQVQKAVEDIYTPKPGTESRLEQATQNFMDKLPMTEMLEEMNELNDSLEESKRNLMNPNQERIELGGRFRFIPELPESEVSILDVTEYKDFIKTFRMLMEATLWVSFIQMLMNWITPKPQI